MKLPKVKTQIQVRYSDIDTYEHVSNSVYMQYFDLGRQDLFRAMIEAGGEVQTHVVANVNIDMLQEIKLGDDVWIATWCSKIGNKSLVVEQHIHANNKLVTKASLTLVGFDKHTRKTTSWPDHWQPSSLSGEE